MSIYCSHWIHSYVYACKCILIFSELSAYNILFCLLTLQDVLPKNKNIILEHHNTKIKLKNNIPNVLSDPITNQNSNFFICSY